MDTWTWIPLADRKPSKFDRYLMGGITQQTATGWYLPRYDTWLDDRRRETLPTHWAELPSPPGVSEEVMRMVNAAVVDIDHEFMLKHGLYLDGPGPVELSGDERKLAHEAVSGLVDLASGLRKVSASAVSDGTVELLTALRDKLRGR
jgi:hypothetical protein